MRKASRAFNNYNAFGASGSTDSGPESDRITPNILARTAVQYPSHQNDRDKLISGKAPFRRIAPP